jgi:hypothetical protein
MDFPHILVAYFNPLQYSYFVALIVIQVESWECDTIVYTSLPSVFDKSVTRLGAAVLGEIYLQLLKKM